MLTFKKKKKRFNGMYVQIYVYKEITVQHKYFTD